MSGYFMTDMQVFWVLAIGLTIGVAVILVRSMKAPAGTDMRQDLRIYRDQLAEVDRDVARGISPADEAERLKAEISRRLLDAHASAASRPTVRAGNSVGCAALVGVALAAAALLYLRIGAAGYPDMPTLPRIAALEASRMERPAQSEAEALVTSQPPAPDPYFAKLVEQLRLAVERNPADLRGQQLLARNEAALGNFVLAAAAQRQAMDLQAELAADDHASLAELLVQAAGGYVSPEAETSLIEALKLDPHQPLALYLAGLMMAQGGRDDLAFHDWNLALEIGPADAYWRIPVLEAMPQIAARAGMPWTPPAALPPRAATTLSALPDDARDTAIRGMVEGLATRLGDQGGTADEWARLIRAYGVLGRDAEARSALHTANSIFTGRDLATVRAAATQAGIVQ